MHLDPTSHFEPPFSHRKSKRIRKALEQKISIFFQQERQQQSAVDIYVDSSQEEPGQNHNFKYDNCSELLPTLKIETPEERSSSWSQEDCSSISACTFLKRVSNEISTPILQAPSYKPVEQTDFEVYTTFLARTKIYGGLLMDDLGRLLWCDKMTHQLLEGSLNNFERIRISSLLLNCQLKNFLQQLKSIRHFDDKTILQWIVYSKNSKRRYKNIPLAKQPTLTDIFYRFLKALTVRVRPISICLPTYRDLNGFCNESLVPKHRPLNCFFLELRLTKRPPSFQSMEIMTDPVIKTFIKNTRLKLAERVSFSEAKIEEEEDELNSALSQTDDKMEEKIRLSRRRQDRKRGARVESSGGRVRIGKKEGYRAKSMLH